MTYQPLFLFITIAAIVGTMVCVLITALVIYTEALPHEWVDFFLNGSFLLTITLSIGVYFGKKLKDIVVNKAHLSTSQTLGKKPNRNIERSFLDMVKSGYGNDGGATDEELLHELVLLIGMLKRAHTPEAKLRLCNDRMTQWKNMLMLISDDLVTMSYGSSSYPSAVMVQSVPYKAAPTKDIDEKKRII